MAEDSKPDEALHGVYDSLTDEQLEGIAGGKQGRKVFCPEGGERNWAKTGNTRPGKTFGNTWPDEEERCTKCGNTRWVL